MMALARSIATGSPSCSVALAMLGFPKPLPPTIDAIPAGEGGGYLVGTARASLYISRRRSARRARRSYSSAVRAIAARAPGSAVSPSAIVRISAARLRQCSASYMDSPIPARLRAWVFNP